MTSPIISWGPTLSEVLSAEGGSRILAEQTSRGLFAIDGVRVEAERLVMGVEQMVLEVRADPPGCWEEVGPGGPQPAPRLVIRAAGCTPDLTRFTPGQIVSVRLRKSAAPAGPDNPEYRTRFSVLAVTPTSIEMVRTRGFDAVMDSPP